MCIRDSVTSFHINARNWAIHEIVAETGHWYSGKQILITTDDIARISYPDKKIFVRPTKAEIQRAADDDLARIGVGIHGAGEFYD